MTGLTDLAFSYAGRTTATGMRDLTWSWSTDGSSFTDLWTVDHHGDVGVNYVLVERDLSGVTALNNASAVYLRGTFATQDGQSTPTTAGNTRFDNVQFTAIPEPTTLGLLLGVGGLLALRRFRRRG